MKTAKYTTTDAFVLIAAACVCACAREQAAFA